jgi:hypothetical protein
VIDRQGDPGYAIAIESSTSLAFQVGLTIEDVGIISTKAKGTDPRSGIYIKGVWQATFRGVRVQSMTGNGIYLDSPLGDDDAPVNVTLDNCYLWDNTLYGLRAVCGPGKRGPGTPGLDPAAGTSNISFLTVQSCSIQSNLKGGISWTGTGCSIRDTGIAMNGHSPGGVGGLYVDYSGASNMTLEVTSSTFENNSPRHVHVRSLLCGVFTNVEFRNSVPSIDHAIEGVRFEPAAATLPSPGFSKPGGPAAVEQITFVNPNIHVIPEVNPFSQFVLDATNGPIRGVHVYGPMWRTFDSHPPDPQVDHTRFALINSFNIHDLQRTSPQVQSPVSIKLVPGNNNGPMDPHMDIGLDAEEFVLHAPPLSVL